MTTNNPVLVAVTHTSLTNGELFLIHHSKKIFADEYLSLYVLYPDSIKKLKPMQSYLTHLMADSSANKSISDSIISQNPLLTKYTARNSFVPVTLESEDKRIKILDSTFTMVNDSAIDLSFWMFIDNIKPAFPYIHFEVFDTTGKIFFKEQFIHPKQLGSVYRDWLRIQINEQIPVNTFRLRVFLIDSKKSVISRIVLRELSAHYFESVNNELQWIDNYPVW
jgi:hypothetical protein